ncbi:MAG: SusD/RagB family nutrient-binding outer membrane lipoprotein, partial [Flavobacteriaceae bacterium]|nr:SusD/RagB family nutrient-binding outer membrane lipoprotein [Flavobacteriaceae bacterium]
MNSPAFDDSTVIYADLMTRIDALLAIDPTNATVKESFDFLYAGDLDEWVKFANSVKLKLMIRQSETSNYNNGDVLSFVTSNSFLDNS